MNKRKVPKIRFKGFYDDWEQRKLGEVTELKSASRVHKGEWTDSGVPFFRSSDVMAAINGATNEKAYISEELYEKLSSASGKLEKGDVLVTGGGSVGNPYIVPNNEPLYTKDADLLWIKNQGRFHPYFLYEHFFSPTFRTYLNSISHVGTIAHYTITQLSETSICLPDIEEQIKVGEYFDSLDHLITLHQKKCFECEKRRFSSASISWEQRKLGEIIQLGGSGGTPSATNPNYYGGEIPFLGIADIEGRDIVHTAKTLTEKGLRNSAAWIVPAGAVSLAMYASVGKVGIIRQDTATSQAFYNMVFEDVAIRDFVFTRLEKADASFEWEPYISTGTQRNLNAAKVKAFAIAVPGSREAAKIGRYFANLDSLITLHQRKLELLKRLRNSLVDRCFIGEKYTMSKLILYHGSPNRVIVPKFGFGEDRHDHGRGFYLTENLELAKEWAVCRPDETNGWVHKYELEMDGLNILDFQKYDVLSWLAELMKHRDAADSRRYKMLAQKFIEKYGIDTCGYDVITGWRANASYFYIAKEFVRDNIDIEILEELLSLGGLGIQFCIKSERAFAQLSEVEQDIMSVDYSEFNDRYNSGTTICRAARS